MKSWLRVTGLVKILFFEFIAMFSLAMALGSSMRAFGALGCAPIGHINHVEVISLLIGLACAAWLVLRIVRPVEVALDFRPAVPLGSVKVPNLAVPAVEFSFPSTHPSYVLVEIVGVAIGAILLVTGKSPSVAGCEGIGFYLIPRIAVGVGLFFPLFRLFSWYVLGRRVPVGRGVWKPVGIFWAILAPFVLLFGGIVLSDKMKERRLPLVDESTFAGGLASHERLAGQLVRVRGVLKQDHAARCDCHAPKDPKYCTVGALLIDLGPGGEVIAHATGSDGEDLFEKGDRPAGEPVEVIGRLGALPQPPFKSLGKPDCGFDEFGPAPPSGRAYLQVEYP